MDLELNQIEARVLGCLLEKEMATPDYYPLSLNALINACNQKTNREPVVEYDEETVLEGLDGLKEQRLAWQSDASRVPKFAQNLDKTLNLTRRESALLCLLLLRGPQTPGELRGRSERLYEFTGIDEVLETLKNLEEMQLITLLPRQPGRKEARYVHLLTGAAAPGETIAGSDHAAAPAGGAGKGRISALEERIAELESELGALRREFSELKDQLGS